jgi:hypothetical protein
MRVAITCCAALLLSGPAALGGSPEERFAEAQSLFDAAKTELAQADSDNTTARKKFYDAASRFADLARDGIRSVNLYVNTGNAFHFSRDNARALLWYLRAHRLSNTAETRNGLVALRNACNAEPWPHESGSIGRVLMFWHYDVRQSLKLWILIATYPLGCLMIIVALFVSRRSAWIRLGLALMVVGATLGISDVVATANGDGHWAIVLEDGTGYAGDSESYSTVVDRISPGQEVKIIETREEWVQVALPSGVTCWLRADVCEGV